jgi:hypothetical protein
VQEGEQERQEGEQERQAQAQEGEQETGYSVLRGSVETHSPMRCL